MEKICTLISPQYLASYFKNKLNKNCSLFFKKINNHFNNIIQSNLLQSKIRNTYVNFDKKDCTIFLAAFCHKFCLFIYLSGCTVSLLEYNIHQKRDCRCARDADEYPHQHRPYIIPNTTRDCRVDLFSLRNLHIIHSKRSSFFV